MAEKIRQPLRMSQGEYQRRYGHVKTTHAAETPGLETWAVYITTPPTMLVIEEGGEAFVFGDPPDG